MVAMLRGINVSGRRPVAMPALRALVAGLGLERPETCINSGNLLVSSDRPGGEIADLLAAAIAARFRFAVPIVVRDAAAGRDHAAASAFPAAERESPGRLMLVLAAGPPLPGAVAAIRERAVSGERLEPAGGALWIHYRDGVARSRRTAAMLDKAFGGPATARDWNSVQRIAAMLAA